MISGTEYTLKRHSSIVDSRGIWKEARGGATRLSLKTSQVTIMMNLFDLIHLPTLGRTKEYLRGHGLRNLLCRSEEACP